MVIGLALGSSAAHADDLPSVKITADGPSQDFPTDKSFYVTGDANKATAVQVAIVRKGSAWMRGGDGVSCKALATALHVEQPTTEVVDPGVTSVSTVFSHLQSTADTDRVLMSARWTAAAATDKTTFRALVTTSSTFFYPGYSYCVYVLQTLQQHDSQTLVKITTGLADTVALCHEPAAGAGPTAEDCISQKVANYKTELDAEVAKLVGAAASADVSAANAKTASVKTAANKTTSLAIPIVKARADLLARHRNWAPNSIAPSPVAFLDVHDHGLGEALAIALARQGALIVDPGTPTQFRLDDRMHAFAIGGIRIHGNELTIEVAPSRDPEHGGRVVVGVSSRDLQLRDGVSLYDLLCYVRGAIAVDPTNPIARDQVVAQVSAVALDKKLADSFHAMAVKADAIAKLFDGNPAAPDPGADEPDGMTLAHVTWLVRHFLSGQPGGKDMQWIGADLFKIDHQKPLYDAFVDQLTVDTGEVVKLAGPVTLPIHTEVSESAWVFSYLTPIVGYAFYDTPESWISTPYVGFQLHFYPNPANDPLWSHAEERSHDLRRAFALEFGTGATTSGMGADNRYRGWLGLPPPTFALALHAIPYTSVSFGVALLERRETVLAAENRNLRFTFLIGLSVQANIPDLIKGQSMTTTQKQN